MSANKFLQRFEGKIQVVSKEGVQNIFGGKNQNAVVYTNNNFKPNIKNQTSSSLNKPKNNDIVQPSRQNKNLAKKQNNQNQIRKQVQKNVNEKQIHKKIDNPFLISNPFYLDQQEKQKIQEHRKAKQIEELQEKQRIKQELKKNQNDNKKSTHGSMNRSLDTKKKTDKQWTKMGGLGANIGGEDWLEKKKKLDKMQQFSQQVKSINKDKPKVPRPQKRQQRKDLNPRQKAIQYSKNVPKPVVRVLQKQDIQEQIEVVQEKQLSELELYQQRHQQLKNLVKNQL